MYLVHIGSFQRRGYAEPPKNPEQDKKQMSMFRVSPAEIKKNPKEEEPERRKRGKEKEKRKEKRRKRHPGSHKAKPRNEEDPKNQQEQCRRASHQHTIQTIMIANLNRQVHPSWRKPPHYHSTTATLGTVTSHAIKPPRKKTQQGGVQSGTGPAFANVGGQKIGTAPTKAARGGRPLKTPRSTQH